MSNPEKSYDVGYGRPPKETQFQKGQSGNPKGRPKGAQNLARLARLELNQNIDIQENGRPVRMSRGRVMIKQHIAKALKGDPRAAEFILKLDQRAEIEELQSAGTSRLTEDDQAIIDRFIASRQGSAGGGNDQI